MATFESMDLHEVSHVDRSRQFVYSWPVNSNSTEPESSQVGTIIFLTLLGAFLCATFSRSCLPEIPILGKPELCPDGWTLTNRPAKIIDPQEERGVEILCESPSGNLEPFDRGWRVFFFYFLPSLLVFGTLSVVGSALTRRFGRGVIYGVSLAALLALMIWLGSKGLL